MQFYPSYDGDKDLSLSQKHSQCKAEKLPYPAIARGIAVGERYQEVSQQARTTTKRASHQVRGLKRPCDGVERLPRGAVQEGRDLARGVAPSENDHRWLIYREKTPEGRPSK